MRFILDLQLWSDSVGTDQFLLWESHRLSPAVVCSWGERERERMTQRARAEKKKYRKGWKQLHWAGTGQLSEEDGNESCCSYSPLIMNILYWLDWFPPPPFTKCHIVKMEEKGSKVASVAVAVADQLWMSECPGWLSCRMARSAFCHSE